MSVGGSAESGGSGGLLGAIGTDLRRLHGNWISIAFPGYRSDPHPVLGAWRPEGGVSRVLFRLWSLLGLGAVVVIYPFLLAGFFVRFHVHRMDRFAAKVGFIGVILTSILAWSALTAAAYLRAFPVDGLIAVMAAGGVATVSAVLAIVFSRVGGRAVSVLIAYPLGVTAIFLPPVVAALYSEVVAAVVFARSDLLAIWILDSLLAIGGINEFLRASFDLVGVAYVGMWFGIAVPVGWVLGVLVTLADTVRPRGGEQSDASAM